MYVLILCNGGAPKTGKVTYDTIQCSCSKCACEIPYTYQAISKETKNTKQKKKIVRKQPHSQAECLVAIRCKQTAYIPILTKLGKGRHISVRAWPRHSRSAWAETLQMHGFLYKHIGKTLEGRDFNSKAWIKLWHVKAWGTRYVRIPEVNGSNWKIYGGVANGWLLALYRNEWLGG